MGFQPVRACNFRLSRLIGLALLAQRETILYQTAERSAPFQYRREDKMRWTLARLSIERVTLREVREAFVVCEVASYGLGRAGSPSHE